MKRKCYARVVVACILGNMKHSLPLCLYLTLSRILRFLKTRYGTLHVVIITRICVIQHLNTSNQSNVVDFVESLKNIYSRDFTPPENVITPSNEFLNLGVILINISNSSRFDSKFEQNAIKELNSILTYSSGIPIHIIVLTNSGSVGLASQLIGDLLAKRVSEQVILRRSWRWSRLRGLPVIKTS